MLTEKADGTYRFSTRFWIYTIIATLIIGWIGWRTQDTANRVEAQAQWNTQYAEANNRCINQLLDILGDRPDYTARLDDIDEHRQEIFDRFIIDLAAINTDQPQVARDIEAKPIIEKYLKDRAALSKQRLDVLAERAANPYPAPTCGQR